jgi:hypothetical protein
MGENLMSEYKKVTDLTVSIDPGQLQDKSTISVLIREEKRIKPGFDPEFVEEIKYRVVSLGLLPMMTPYTKQADYVLGIAGQLKEKYNNRIIPTITLDAGGVGLPVLDVLHERMRQGKQRYPVFPIRYTGGFYPSAGKKSIRNVPKAEIFQVLMVAMQNQEIEINDDTKYAPILREEMRNFKTKYHERGLQTMEAARGHDDLLCSVADGLYMLKKRTRIFACENPLPERQGSYFGKQPGEA